MGFLDNAKELVGLVQRVGDLELYRKIVDLQSDAVALAARNFDLESENRALKSKLAEQDALEFRQPYYWKRDDPVPFCPKCKDADGRAARMSDAENWNGGVRRRCHACGELVYEKPMILNEAIRFQPYA